MIPNYHQATNSDSSFFLNVVLHKLREEESIPA